MIRKLYEELFTDHEISYETYIDRVYDCIKSLKREHSGLMTDIYINGYTCKQLALNSYTSLESIKNRLENGKKELKLLLIDDNEITINSPILKINNRCSFKISELTIGEVIDMLNEYSMEPSRETDILIDCLLENNFELEVSELYRFDKPYPVNLFHQMYKDIGYDIKGDERFDVLKFILNGTVKDNILTPTQYTVIEKRYKENISLKECATKLHESRYWLEKQLNEIEIKLRDEIARRM